MKTYYYPQNLKSRATLWFWSLRDFVILCTIALISVAIWLNTGFVLPAAMSICFGFVTMRKDEFTIMDFLTWSVRFFIITQQFYLWGGDTFGN